MISAILILLLILISGVLNNALNIIVLGLFISAVIYKFPKVLNKTYIFYIVFFILGVASFVFYDISYFYLITHGIFGYSLFFVVMFVGVLPNRWEISRIIKKHRGTLSIIGFIIITPHVLLHLLGYLNGINFFGIAAYIIMVPLTLISFRFVKKEIAVKDWLNIQKAAYVIYVVLLIHLIVVSSVDNMIVYVILLTLYVNNKIYKEHKR